MDILNKYSRTFLAFLVFLQVLLIVFWGSKRENFYWDEFFTYEKAHYCSSSTPYEHYITEDTGYRLNEWLPISMVQDTLTVNYDESVLVDPVWETFHKLFGYYNYVVYMNAIEALFFEGEVSIWAGIITNIIFFIINQFLLYLLAKKISNNKAFALATVAFYGFSGICLSMATFVRFYMLATLFITIFVLLHYEYWNTEENEHLKRVVYLALASLALLSSFNNAQFALLYGGFFILIFSVMLFIKKGFRRFAYYFLPLFAGGVGYLYAKTEYLYFFIDFDRAFNTTNGAFKWVLEQIVDFKPYMLPGRINEMGYNFGRYLFGSFVFMIVFLLIFSAIFVKKAVQKRNCEEKNDFVLIIFLSLIIYFVLFTAFNLYEQIRYTSYVFPICALAVMWMAYMLLESERLKILSMALLLVVQFLSVNIKGKVDMLYTGDAQFIEKIRNENADSIMIYSGMSEFMIYQSALLVGKDAEFFAYDGKSLNEAEIGIRDGMLFIKGLGNDYDEFYSMIERKGYDVVDIGWTYAFCVQKLKKR